MLLESVVLYTISSFWVIERRLFTSLKENINFDDMRIMQSVTESHSRRTCQTQKVININTTLEATRRRQLAILFWFYFWGNFHFPSHCIELNQRIQAYITPDFPAINYAVINYNKPLKLNSIENKRIPKICYTDYYHRWNIVCIFAPFATSSITSSHYNLLAGISNGSNSSMKSKLQVAAEAENIWYNNL